jgi:cell division protein FtsL
MMARQTREQLKRLNALTEAQAALGWGVILVLAALLGTIYVSQASRIASVGRQVQILQNELIELKRQNNDLERDIAAAQALDRLQAEATRLGFVETDPEDIEYIIVPDYPVTLEETDPLEILPTVTAVPPPAETVREALWLYLSDRFTDFIRGEAREQ